MFLVFVFLFFRKRAFHTQAAASSDSEPSLPAHWDPMDSSDQEFQRVTLQTISDEYKRALKLFGETIPSDRITKVERVQNPDTWMEFVQYVIVFYHFQHNRLLSSMIFQGVLIFLEASLSATSFRRILSFFLKSQEEHHLNFLVFPARSNPIFSCFQEDTS